MQPLGNLAVAAAVHIGVQQTGTARWLQAVKAMPKTAERRLPCKLIATILPGGKGCLCIQVRCSRFVKHGFARAIAYAIQGRMPDDAVDPSTGRATAGVKTRCPLPDGHKSVVKHILCRSAVTNYSESHTQQVACFMHIDAAQGFAITLRAGLQRSGVVESVVLEGGSRRHK